MQQKNSWVKLSISYLAKILAKINQSTPEELTQKYGDFAALVNVAGNEDLLNKLKETTGSSSGKLNNM